MDADAYLMALRLFISQEEPLQNYGQTKTPNFKVGDPNFEGPLHAWHLPCKTTHSPKD